MTKSVVPSSSNAPGSAHPAGTVPAVESLEDQLIRTWNTSRGTIIGVIAVAILAVAGVYAWQWMQERRDAGVTREFSAASTPAELKAFLAAHGGHPLAGLAQLRLAYAFYASGTASEAIAAYDQAATVLKSGPFAGRARLGAALARLSSGQTAAAEPLLKQISEDATLPINVRTEASYNLVNLAAEAGRLDEVGRLSDEMLRLDASSPWAQRALMLRARLAPPAAPVAPATPAAAPAAPASAPAAPSGMPAVPVFP